MRNQARDVGARPDVTGDLSMLDGRPDWGNQNEGYDGFLLYQGVESWPFESVKASKSLLASV